MSAIEHSEIIKVLLENKKLSDEIDKFFRHDSLFMKAFEKYVYCCEIGECPFFDKYAKCAYTKGHYPISLRNIYPHALGALSPSDTIRFTFTVYLNDEDEINRSTIMIVDVPEYLLLIGDKKEFEISFNDWIKAAERKHFENKVDDIKSKMATLMNKLVELENKVHKLSFQESESNETT